LFVYYSKPVFLRCFRYLIWFSRIENQVLRIRENHQGAQNTSNYMKFSQIFQVHSRYLTFSLEKRKKTAKTIFNLILIYLFMTRHEVHGINTHSAERRLMKKDKTVCSTRHWSW